LGRLEDHGDPDQIGLPLGRPQHDVTPEAVTDADHRTTPKNFQEIVDLAFEYGRWRDFDRTGIPAPVVGDDGSVRQTGGDATKAAGPIQGAMDQHDDCTVGRTSLEGWALYDV
jgi:hypothetical protein